MAALTTVKLILAAVLVVTVLAGLILGVLAAAFREDDRDFPQPQTDESAP